MSDQFLTFPIMVGEPITTGKTAVTSEELRDRKYYKHLKSSEFGGSESMIEKDALVIASF